MTHIRAGFSIWLTWRQLCPSAAELWDGMGFMGWHQSHLVPLKQQVTDCTSWKTSVVSEYSLYFWKLCSLCYCILHVAWSRLFAAGLIAQLFIVNICIITLALLVLYTDAVVAAVVGVDYMLF